MNAPSKNIKKNIKKTIMNANRLSQNFLSSKMRQEAHAPA
jgi:hypothetical protein